MAEPNRKRKWLGGLIVALAAAGLVAGFALRHFGAEEQRQVGPYRAAPRFELPDVGGKVHRLEDFSGNLVLVHFWASWCPPCLEELPALIEMAARFKDRPFRVIAISLDEKWEDAERVLKSSSLPPDMISLIDLKKRTPDAYGTFQYPESYLVGPKHEIIMKWVGQQDWKEGHIPSLLEQLFQALENKAKVKKES